MQITFEDVRQNQAINAYIQKADESLIALGYTEHSFPHVLKVASTASQILTELGYSPREAELAKIAGYLHDIGNIVNRIEHAQSGAVMAFRILDNMGAEAEDIATIVTAIGNHDESTAFPVNSVAAALILADKTDVRRTRVRRQPLEQFDIHDRVNFSVTHSQVMIEKTAITLDITIKTEICDVLEYFEIFMERMLLCRRAAEQLKVAFHLIVNGQKMM
ncbi:MAG: HD domain-containing protein [Anaerovoracaceae bacterium]|nr:HD domain-containing protein [Anaerovoracaceae bacterium]